MGNSLRVLTRWFIPLFISGCSLTQPNPAPVIDSGGRQNQGAGGYRADQILQTGLRQYDRAQYTRAASSLQQAIYRGLTLKRQVIAHKHLAFIYCISNRVSQCRAEFRNALGLDPRFDLAPAEAGHPQWGPVFRSVKASRRKSASHEAAPRTGVRFSVA